MPEAGDTRRLLARGVAVTLADGAVHEIRFPARLLARMEDDYDGLENFADALRRKPFRTVGYVLHLTLGAPPDRAVDLIESRRMGEYVIAIGEALEEALPEQDQGNGKAAPGESESPGAASSTSAWSPGASAPGTSGT